MWFVLARVDVQAVVSYDAGMQYTLRRIPKAVDKALRDLARRQGRSLNDVAVEALARSCGLTDEPVKHRNLTGIAGTWVEDPDFDAALADQDRIDAELWK